MIIIKHIADLNKYLLPFYNARTTIGFVPTMGALHAGHISLLQKTNAEQELSVASIYINPTQFNSARDFEKYPVTIERDIDMLEAAGCDILFLPFTSEIYPAGEATKHYSLGDLEDILEGQYRPGHFQGVCQVVDKLLHIVKPSALYLGLKDYQQCMVIEKMIEIAGHKISLHLCPTVREADGLAMSSRNLRLNDAQRKIAPAIYNSLQQIKTTLLPGITGPVSDQATSQLQQQGFKVDYVSISDAITLEPITNWNGNQKLVALVAAYLDEIRLIDNLGIN